MVRSRNSAANTLALANGPVLVEGSGALDRWGVDTGVLVDLVGAAIGVNGALVGATSRGVVVAEGLNDVVLDEGVGGPTVDGEVAATVGVVAARVGDGARLKLRRRAPAVK